jgi:hypothetical protein
LFEAEKKNSMIYFHVGNPDVPDIPALASLLATAFNVNFFSLFGSGAG